MSLDQEAVRPGAQQRVGIVTWLDGPVSRWEFDGLPGVWHFPQRDRPAWGEDRIERQPRSGHRLDTQDRDVVAIAPAVDGIGFDRRKTQFFPLPTAGHRAEHQGRSAARLIGRNHGHDGGWRQFHVARTGKPDS